ncbi:MAG TPA: hypothetical protein VMR41_04770 [Patescibacteria group bacterium]|nr:hypothetical protein [Patescibacteria group bacterium]
MDIYEQMAVRIIQSQEKIISNEALNEAKNVQGLQIEWEKKMVAITGDKKKVIEQLIEQYRDHFGQPAVEMCKQAVKDLIIKLPQGQTPQQLQ